MTSQSACDVDSFCTFLDAEYRNELSEGILQMQESGKLAQLKIKWWKEKRGGGACQVRILLGIAREMFSLGFKRLHSQSLSFCISR